MNVNQLNTDQLEELAQSYLAEHYHEYNPDAAELEGPSYGELAAALEIVGRDTLATEYADTVFSSDDFLCTAAQPESFEVREIDALAYDDGWVWNTSYSLGSFCTYSDDIPRALRRYLKQHHGITFYKGRTVTEYDGDVYEICDRATHEPLFAAIPQEA